jgi:hypothetical protein
LADLAKVNVISESLASLHFYAHRKTGAGQTLKRLVNAGIVDRRAIYTPTGREYVYSFSSQRAAQAWGGVYQKSNINRSDFHELLTARAYFELGKPTDFRCANQFKNEDVFAGLSVVNRTLPDAVYTDSNGHTVFVESDAGHYTTRQIRDKMSAWGDVKQVWVQPRRSSAQVPAADHVDVLKF